jgi:hypothetical protein
LEPSTFCRRGPKYLKVGHWNIQGLRNKTDNINIINWFLEHDIVFLNELKTRLKFSVPGFSVYRAKTVNPHRGGVAVLIKNYLEEYLTSVDTEGNDIVWLTFSFMPNVVIGGTYIPPIDLPYFSETLFSQIQEKCIDKDANYVIIGDFNARCGRSVDQLVSDTNFKYRNFADDQSNCNGRKVVGLCKDLNFVVVNGLSNNEKHFQSDYTFRRKDLWIYQVDLCLASRNLITDIIDFKIDQ